MSAPHRRATRVVRTGEAARWLAGDAARLIRDWRPPRRPEPPAERAERAPRPPRTAEPIWGRSDTAATVRRTLQRRAVFPLLTALARPRVEGGHHLLAAPRPLILAPNHVSHSDAPLVLQALPDELRERTLVPAASDYFFDRRWLSVVVTMAMNAVPFDRRHDIADSVRRCERFLRHGFSIVLFPEGSRSFDGRLRGFKAGVAHLAVQTGAPVVPVYLQGTHGLLPRGKAVPRPSAVTVHFGAALRATPEESARQFNERLESAVLELAASARGWAHLDRPPRRGRWRESWQASQRHGLAAVAASEGRFEESEDGAAAQRGEGSWRARWQSTTPR